LARELPNAELLVVPGVGHVRSSKRPRRRTGPCSGSSQTFLSRPAAGFRILRGTRSGFHPLPSSASFMPRPERLAKYHPRHVARRRLGLISLTLAMALVLVAAGGTIA